MSCAKPSQLNSASMQVCNCIRRVDIALMGSGLPTFYKVSCGVFVSLEEQYSAACQEACKCLTMQHCRTLGRMSL